MKPEDLVKRLLQLDKDVRWVGVVDQRGEILQNVQGPGVESLTDPTTEGLTLKELPTIMGLFWRDHVGRSGKLKSVLVSYTRVYLFAFNVEGNNNVYICNASKRNVSRVTQRRDFRLL
jgi:hypothetical protein